MTTLVLLIQPVAFLAALALIARHAERAATDANVTARLLVATVEHERDARRDDIQMLLQRIQAPQHAVYQHAADTSPLHDDVMPRSETESAQATDQYAVAQQVLDEIARIEAEANRMPGLVAE